MPTYDFRCDTCGHEFEENIRLSAPLPACPGCGGGVRKLISPVSFQLKGGGWYKDHYGLKKGGDVGGKSDAGGKGDAVGKSDGGGSDGGGKKAATSGDA